VHVGMLLFLGKHQYMGVNSELSQVAKTSLVAFAGASMVAHCLLFDFYKNLYLAAGQGTPNQVSAPAVVSDPQGGSIKAPRPLTGIYTLYEKVQLALVPAGAEHSAESSASRVRLWGAIGPANHHALLVLTLFCAAFTKDAPFYYIFFVGVIMNIYLAALLVTARAR
jgi:hypothetical protein